MVRSRTQTLEFSFSLVFRFAYLGPTDRVSPYVRIYIKRKIINVQNSNDCIYTF
jgi:hypothetical protein